MEKARTMRGFAYVNIAEPGNPGLIEQNGLQGARSNPESA